MKLSFKIPIWCVPWRARRTLIELNNQLTLERERLAREREDHTKTIERIGKLEASGLKNKHAISSMVSWLWATHRIDQRADQHGLTDILKEFPRS